MSSPPTTPTSVSPVQPMPLRIFLVEVGYLIALIALLIVYKTDHGLREALPAFGKIPVSVVWFGATGAVLAGLGGIFFHNADWDSSYDYWHYSRPLVGGVVGGIGSLLYYVTILVGTTNSATPRTITFNAVAFLFGFADEAFREQVTKLTKLILGPGESDPGASGSGGHRGR
jgi:hypothetical protein